MTSAETSIIPEFKAHIERMGVREHFDITKKDIYNKLTGSFIWFRGIKAGSNSQKANLKSLSGVTTFVVEEGEDFQDERAFDTIDDSIRTTTKQNRVIWIQNPSTKEHFIYKRWVERNPKFLNVDGFEFNIGNHPDVEHIHTTYLDNADNLTDSWLYKAEQSKEHNKDWYLTNYLGAWREKAEGAVFHNWRVGEFPKDLDVIYAVDWGFKDPFAVSKVAIKDNKIYIDEVCYSSGLTPNTQVELLQYATDSGELIIADNADKSMILLCRQHNLNIMPCLSKDKVSVGVRALQNYEIIVTENSRNAIVELQNYAWADKVGEVPIDKYNHCFTGDTLITTSKGYKQIKDIDCYDRVLTRNGYKQVLKRWNNGLKTVNKYLLLFDTQTIILEATKDHKIKTDRGWIEIQNLQADDVLYLHKNLTEKHITNTQMKGTSQKEGKNYTGLFGSITMAQFLKAIIYIIKTGTPKTMIYQIYRLFMVSCIQGLKVRKGLKTILSLLKSLMRKVLSLQKNGISQRRVESGTRNTQKKTILENGIYQIKNAVNVDAILNQKLIQQNFVQTNANLSGEEIKDLTMSQENVKTAEKNLKPTDIQKSRLVTSVVLSSYETKVYDLMVDEKHEYFANGVLVHNCIDGWRYVEKFWRLSNR
jgi:phage terminase large subunit